jgi:hypothetical protein
MSPSGVGISSVEVDGRCLLKVAPPGLATAVDELQRRMHAANEPCVKERVYEEYASKFFVRFSQPCHWPRRRRTHPRRSRYGWVRAFGF